MADWGRTVDELLDGMSLPQFRLLAQMRQRRIAEQRRWDLQLASVTGNIQSKEQAEAIADMMDSLAEVETGKPSHADMGGGFTVSKRHPLLHELTPTQVAGNPQLRNIIKFRTVEEKPGGES